MVSSYNPLTAAPEQDLAILDRRRAERRKSSLRCHMLDRKNVLTAIMSDVSATGAYLLTAHRIPLETVFVLQHPYAGQIEARVVRHHLDGIGVSFLLNEASVGFTLRAVTAEMTHTPPWPM